MMKTFTVDDIIEINKKYNKNGEYGGFMQIDESKAKSNIKPSGNNAANAANANKTTYIPIRIKGLDGSLYPLRLKCSQIILTSPAKISSFQNDPTKPIKDVQIGFRKITIEDLQGSDYQDLNGLIYKNFVESSERFTKALDIICEEFRACVKRDIFGSVSIETRTRKIAHFRQDYRKLSLEERQQQKKGELKFPVIEDPSAGLVTPLDRAIYRLKVPVEPRTKKIGYCYKDKKEQEIFKYVVFDIKETQKNKVATPAKVKDITGNMTDLTIDNIGDYLTALSCMTFIVTFDNIILSSLANSLGNKVSDIYTLSHSKAKYSLIDEADRKDLESIAGILKPREEDPEQIAENTMADLIQHKNIVDSKPEFQPETHEENDDENPEPDANEEIYKKNKIEEKPRTTGVRRKNTKAKNAIEFPDD